MGPGSDGPMGGMGGMEPHHMNGSLGKPATLLGPAAPWPADFSQPQLLAQLDPQEDPKRKILPGWNVFCAEIVWDLDRRVWRPFHRRN